MRCQPAGGLFSHGQYRVGTQYFGDGIKKNGRNVGSTAGEQGGASCIHADCGLCRPVRGANVQIELQELIVRNPC